MPESVKVLTETTTFKCGCVVHWRVEQGAKTPLTCPVHGAIWARTDSEPGERSDRGADHREATEWEIPICPRHEMPTTGAGYCYRCGGIVKPKWTEVVPQAELDRLRAVANQLADALRRWEPHPKAEALRRIRDAALKSYREAVPE